jgi:hypothetical protein
MNKTPFVNISDSAGRKLEKAGLCRREWFEGMGAGFYLCYPPTPLLFCLSVEEAK